MSMPNASAATPTPVSGGTAPPKAALKIGSQLAMRQRGVQGIGTHIGWSWPGCEARRTLTADVVHVADANRLRQALRRHELAGAGIGGEVERHGELGEERAKRESNRGG